MKAMLKTSDFWIAFGTFALALGMLIAAENTSPGGVFRQRVTIDQLPEDGNLPYLMIFTHDEPTERDQWALDCVSLAAEGHTVRYHHLTPSHPRFESYAPHHQNDLPCILTLSADATKCLSVLRGSHMPSDPIEMVSLIQITDDGSDVKGRLFAPSQPPYWLRPWKWGRRPCPQPTPAPDAKPLPPVNVTVPPAPDAALQARILELEAAKLEGPVEPEGGSPLLPIILGLLGLPAGAAITYKRSIAS